MSDKVVDSSCGCNTAGTGLLCVSSESNHVPCESAGVEYPHLGTEVVESECTCSAS